MKESLMANIDDFFRPRGIAIVGASGQFFVRPTQIYQYAKQMSQSDIVYPVNPLGIKLPGINVTRTCFLFHRRLI